MPENQAKGDVFLKILDQVVKKWGNRGLKEIGADPSQYKVEQWYPFSELCSTLSNIQAKLGNNNPLSVYQLGFRIIKDDPRWQDVFHDQNPAEIFLSTKRQEAQYKAGTQELERVGEKHIRVELQNWDCDDVWYDFFRGRLQGVLELTGRTGVVHLIPQTDNDDDDDDDDASRYLDIKWG